MHLAVNETKCNGKVVRDRLHLSCGGLISHNQAPTHDALQPLELYTYE